MSVTGMNSRMAMAEKLSIPQLQQAIQSGSLPAYVGIPLLQEKMKLQKSMQAMGQQQGEQPTVAEQVMQEAQQETQQQMQQRMAGPGIDQLPSNLPTYDEEEFGDDSYAGGGIVAFAKGEAVEDPDKNPRIEALRQDPAYLAFVEDGGDRGDTSLTAFLQAGNTPTTTASGPEYEPVPATSPAGDFARSVYENVRSRLRAMPDQEQRNEIRNLGVQSGIFGVGSDASRTQAEKELRERLYGTQSTPVTTLPTTVVTAQEDPTMAPQLVAPDMERRDFPAQGSAGSQPTTAPTGTTGAPGATRTAPQGGAGGTGGGRGAAMPPSLEAAEKSDSPVANRAISMLDKYVAMLEKSGEDVGRQKKEALYMALIQGGLAAAGGTSPNALANISAGMVPALQGYQQAVRDIRKEDRARLEKLMAAGISKEKLILEAEKLGIERKKAEDIGAYYRARAGAAGAEGSGAEDIRRANAIRALDSQLSTNLSRVDTQIKNLNSANPMMAAYVNKSPDQIPKGIRDQVAAYRSQLGKLEGEKNKWVNLHSSRVQSLGGVTLGDIDSGSAGGNMPKGIPQGSRQVGTSGGKPVYEAPDGKRYIVE